MREPHHRLGFGSSALDHLGKASHAPVELLIDLHDRFGDEVDTRLDALDSDIEVTPDLCRMAGQQ